MAKFIKQGRYGRHVTPPCGTVGLGTCVGLFAQSHPGWFIAHIDCDISEPRRKHDGAWNLIVESVVRQLGQKCSQGPNGRVLVASGGWGTKSTEAILQGIRNWAGSADVKKIDSWEYRITRQGLGSKRSIGQRANDFDGDGPFTVE